MEASCYPLFWALQALGMHPVKKCSDGTYFVISSRFLVNFFIIMISVALFPASLHRVMPNHYLNAVIDVFFFSNAFNIVALQVLVFLKRKSLCQLVTLLAPLRRRTPRHYYFLGPLTMAIYVTMSIMTTLFLYQSGAVHLWGIPLCSLNQCCMTMWNIKFCFYLSLIQHSYAATMASLPELVLAEGDDALSSYTDLISRLMQLMEQFNKVCHSEW